MNRSDARSAENGLSTSHASSFTFDSFSEFDSVPYDLVVVLRLGLVLRRLPPTSE